MDTVTWMVTIVIGLLVLVIALVIYTEINKPVVTQGVVVDKYHEPAQTWYSYMPMMIGKVMILIPIYHFDDEDWVVVLKGIDQHGEENQGLVYVSRSNYERINVGQFYKMGSADSLNDSDETKEVDEVPEGAEVRDE